MQDNNHGLNIQVNFIVKCVCVCVGGGGGGGVSFGSNGFVIKCSHSLLDGPYRTYIVV
jgi:hypothetical protein